MAGPRIGKPAGSLRKLKSNIKKRSSRGFIKKVPKEGDILLRFLQEPQTFTEYDECTLLQEDGTWAYFPGDESMAQGKDYTRKSTVYLANAVDIENDKVVPFQVKASVLNKMVNKMDGPWDGTIMDRDITVSKYGKGQDTEYDIDSEGRKKRDLSRYELLDLPAVVKAEYDAHFGTDDDEDDEEEEYDSESPRPRSTGRRRPQRRGVVEDDEEEDVVPPRRRKKKVQGTTVRRRRPTR